MAQPTQDYKARGQSDARLVKECLAGSEAAWEQLIERYQRLIYSIPLKMGLAHEACADVFQDVCAILLEKLGTLRNHELLSSWIVTTTRREALRARRSAAREADRHQSIGEDGASETAVPAVLPEVEENLLGLERENRLRIAWSQLDERCRQLIEVLFFGPDEDYARMAQTLNMPIGSIGPTRMRCLSRLRKLLKKQGL